MLRLGGARNAGKGARGKIWIRLKFVALDIFAGAVLGLAFLGTACSRKAFRGRFAFFCGFDGALPDLLHRCVARFRGCVFSLRAKCGKRGCGKN